MVLGMKCQAHTKVFLSPHDITFYYVKNSQLALGMQQGQVKRKMFLGFTAAFEGGKVY